MSAPGLVADLAAAVDTLRAAGVPTPRADAELLAAHAAGTDRGGLQRLVIMRAGWPDGAGSRFDRLVEQRAARVPLQHLTGRAPFRGVELAVGPGVFLPRPETELLAGQAVHELLDLPAGAAPVAVDLCTGSAAVAVAVVDEVAGAEVGAIELDPMAHAWAERNVAALGDGRLELALGDVADTLRLLPGFRGRCQVVTANPPYIPDDAVPVDPEVAEHDPGVALYGGPDGLRVLRVCVGVAAELLVPGGLLVMEHGEPQCDAVAAVLSTSGRWAEVAHHADLTGRPRLTSARLLAATTAPSVG